MTQFYLAADGNYGDATALVVLDTDALPFPLPEDFFDLLGDEDRAPVSQRIIEEADYIVLMRNLIDPDDGDPREKFPEYLRGLVDLLHDLLGVEHEVAEALLLTPSKVSS